MQDLVDYSTKTQTNNSTEPFWPLASGRAIRMAITLVYAAKGKCSVADVYRFITTMPATRDKAATPEFRNSFCGQCLLEAVAKGPDADAELAGEFVLKEYPRMGDRTQACVLAQTMNTLEKFMHGSVRALCSGETTLHPRMC